MKNITIVSAVILLLLWFPISVSGHMSRDTTDGLPQLFDNGTHIAVLKPGARHVTIGQQVSLVVHQKRSALRPIPVNDVFAFSEPILYSHEGNRARILIRVTLQNGHAALLPEA